MFDQLMALQWVKDNIEQFGEKNLLILRLTSDKIEG